MSDDRRTVFDPALVANYVIDMDGVLVHEGTALPGAAAFIARVEAAGKHHLILTNNSRYTTADLAARLEGVGIDVLPEAIWTSALAIAQFLDRQRPAVLRSPWGRQG